MEKVGLKILPDPSSSLYRLIQKTEDLSDRAAIFMTLRRNRVSFLVPRSVHLIVAVGFSATPLRWCQSGNQPLSDLGHGASGICIAVSQSCPSKATCLLVVEHTSPRAVRTPCGDTPLVSNTCTLWPRVHSTLSPEAESRMVFLELLFVVIPAVWAKCQCLASQLHTIVPYSHFYLTSIFRTNTVPSMLPSWNHLLAHFTWLVELTACLFF